MKSFNQSKFRYSNLLVRHLLLSIINLVKPMEKNLTVHATLNEVLVKTSYLIQITATSDKELENPIGFASGFIVEYNHDNFFVTADHVIHIDDYTGNVEKRTWKDYVVAIFNNYSDPDNFPSTIITPLSGFYYTEKYNLEKPCTMANLVDISVCKMKDINFKFPFLTNGVILNGETIKSGEQKFKITKENFGDAMNDKKYSIFGKVRTRLVDNIRMEWQDTLKDSLKFVSKSGDFLLFNTSELIVDKEDWEGLSGSPVFSEDGQCVGVLCDVLINSKSIWVMPITQVKMLIEVAIQQGKIEEINDKK
jgi:hypothetical protein